MSLLAVLSLGLGALTLPSAGEKSRFDLASGVQLSSTNGMMAAVPNEPSQLTTQLRLTMLQGVRVSSERTSFVLRYSPLINYQYPNAADVVRPLFVHNLSSAYQSRLNRRVSFGWNVLGTAGDLNYASLLRAFEGGTTATAGSFVPILFVSTNATLATRTSSKNLLSIGANTAYRTSIDDSDQPQTVVPAQDFGVTVTDAWRFAPNETLSLTAQAIYINRLESNDVVGDTVGGQGSVGWGHRFSQVSSLEINGGVGVSSAGQDVPLTAFPTGYVSFLTQSHALSSVWSFNASAGARGFLDPVLATYRPQVFVSLSATGQHGRRLQSRFAASLATVADSERVVPEQYETFGNCDLGAAYFFVPEFSLQAGVRSSLRAGHFSDLSAPVPQGELAGVLSVRYTLGTDRRHGSWL